MGAYSMDEKILMHFFQDSLAGAAVTWYTNLEASQVQSWKDLATAFIRQYQYNTNMAPDQNQLQSMSKRENDPLEKLGEFPEPVPMSSTPITGLLSSYS